MPAKGIWAFPLICGCWDFGAGSPSPTKDNPINVECPKDPQKKKQDGKASPPQKAQPQKGWSSSKDPKPSQLPKKGDPEDPIPQILAP